MPAAMGRTLAVMRGNRRRDTRCEIAVRRAVHRRGLRYRTDAPLRVGTKVIRPDLLFVAQHLAVFVDGCYWHGCSMHYVAAKTNAEYWQAKIARNRARDRAQTQMLCAAGWRVMRIWAHTKAEDAAAAIYWELSAQRLAEGKQAAGSDLGTSRGSRAPTHSLLPR